MAGIAAMPKSAEVCFLEDVVGSEGRKVRVIGRLCAQDIHQQTIILKSPTRGGASLTVSVRLIYPFEASLGSLYEVIGEFVSSPEGPILQAHTWRSMDGLDMTMYRRAVQMRRDYFSHRDQEAILDNDIG